MDKIGDEELLAIIGLPTFPRQVLEIVERPGVDGTGFWETGFRGRPCTIRTQVDCEDLSDAVDAYNRYLTMIDGEPVGITYGGVDLAAFGAKFQVLDVRAVAIHALACASGGLSDGSGAWCECEWDLLPVPDEPA